LSAVECSPPETSATYKATSALLAFFIWGSWAWYVNAQSANAATTPPIVSGFAHGCGSAAITLVIVRAVTTLFRMLINHPLRTVLPALITTLTTGSCVAFVHQSIGTSNIVGTVVPGMMVAFGYNLATTLKLEK